MEVKELIGTEVFHKVFGTGFIEDAHDNYIQVLFQSEKRSNFSYPSCFDRFLVLKSEENREDVNADLVLWRMESGAEQKEALRQQYLKTQQAIEARRIAAEERKLKAVQQRMRK